MNERVYLSDLPVASSSAMRDGRSRLHAIVTSQRDQWSVKMASSDFRSIVGLPWVV